MLVHPLEYVPSAPATVNHALHPSQSVLSVHLPTSYLSITPHQLSASPSARLGTIRSIKPAMSVNLLVAIAQLYIPALVVLTSITSTQHSAIPAKGPVSVAVDPQPWIASHAYPIIFC